MKNKIAIFLIALFVTAVSCKPVSSESKKTSIIKDTSFITKDVYDYFTKYSTIGSQGDDSYTINRYYNNLNNKLILIEEQYDQNNLHVFFFNHEWQDSLYSQNYLIDCGKWLFHEYIEPYIRTPHYLLEFERLSNQEFINFINHLVQNSQSVTLSTFEINALIAYTKEQLATY